MKQKISIIGGGPAGMMLACLLDKTKFDISIYEKNNTLGRKFLVAGKGGFNLTHSEPIAQMIERYTPSSFLSNALQYFSNEAFIHWLNTIGLPTYVGSSKRIFPKKDIKPVFVLQQVLQQLKKNDVQIYTNMTWNGWGEDGALSFNDDEIINADINIFAMGGGSWKVTGSDGLWLNRFSDKGISTKPFSPSNGALFISWDDRFIEKHEGKAIKNIKLFFDKKEQFGDITITKHGIEGSPAYAMNGIVRGQLEKSNKATIYIDLKPAFSIDQIINKLSLKRKKSWSNHILQQLNFTDTVLSLIKQNTTKEEYTNIAYLAKLIKNLPLHIISLTKLDEAISTVGGIELHEVTKHYELKKMYHNYVIGEMLDWDAPTGGYLLQASFSMGAYLAEHLSSSSPSGFLIQNGES